MIPTFAERQQLAQEFASDVERMRRCLAASNYDVKTDRIVRAWADYSDADCASWLRLPDEDDDAQLLAILMKHLPPVPDKDAEEGLFTAQIVDAGNESGDGMLELPDELLARVGWKAGDVLTISITDAGDLRLKRKDP